MEGNKREVYDWSKEKGHDFDLDENQRQTSSYDDQAIIPIISGRDYNSNRREIDSIMEEFRFSDFEEESKEQAHHEQEVAKNLERNYKGSTSGHPSSGTRHKGTTNAKEKEEEWKEQVSVFTKIKNFATRKLLPVVIVISAVAAGIAGHMIYDDIVDRQIRTEVVQTYEENFQHEQIDPYARKTSTGDGMRYDIDAIAEGIYEDGKVDNYEYWGLYNSMGEEPADRVLDKLGQPSIEEHMRSTGQTDEFGKPDVELWQENIGKALVLESELDGLFTPNNNQASTNETGNTKGGK